MEPQPADVVFRDPDLTRPAEIEASSKTSPSSPSRKRKRAAIAIGSTDDYEETCRLGEGGYGAVVKARHRATGVTVAIKRPLAPDEEEDGRTREEVERDVRREALAHGACSGHPSIVGFRGLARDPATGDLCILMEPVDGPTLSAYLRQHRRPRRRLPEATVRAAMWQLLSAARRMHARHVVHRDIKTDNILVGEGHRAVKICDFGFAVSMAQPPPYEPYGTLWYMAPEVLLDKPDYDALADAWSLGCVMAELIKGRVLFDSGRSEEGQLGAIFDVVGYPDRTTWPWFSTTPYAVQVVPILRNVHRHNYLRKLFPEKLLSEQGFEVLNGLLTCNPDKRLTAAAALKHPWFAKVDALELPKKGEEVASALPEEEEEEEEELPSAWPEDEEELLPAWPDRQEEELPSAWPDRQKEELPSAWPDQEKLLVLPKRQELQCV